MNKTNGKSSLFGKSGKYYVLVGSLILIIAIVHFAMQISFIQKETNLQSVETAVEKNTEIAPPFKQVIQIEPEQFEVKKIEVITIPETVKPAPRREKEIVPAKTPIKTPSKKKSLPETKPDRETRAERLRRAERILTGV